MEQQRPHQHDPASPHTADHLGHLAAEPLDLGVGKAAGAMRAGQDPQRPVVRPRIVQVDAEGHDALEDLHRRLDVEDSLLHGPGAESFHVDVPLSADRQILVPGHLPVGRGRLVEHDPLDRPGPRSEHALGETQDARIARTAADGRHPQRIPQATPPLISRELAQGGPQGFDLLRREHRLDDGVAVLGESVGEGSGGIHDPDSMGSPAKRG